MIIHLLKKTLLVPSERANMVTHWPGYFDWCSELKIKHSLSQYRWSPSFSGWKVNRCTTKFKWTLSDVIPAPVFAKLIEYLIFIAGLKGKNRRDVSLKYKPIDQILYLAVELEALVFTTPPRALPVAPLNTSFPKDNGNKGAVPKQHMKYKICGREGHSS